MDNTIIDIARLIPEIITSLLSPVVIVGAIWYLTRDLKQEIHRIDDNHRQDIQKSEEWYREDRKLADERWEKLLSKFHEHDKIIYAQKK